MNQNRVLIVAIVLLLFPSGAAQAERETRDERRTAERSVGEMLTRLAVSAVSTRAANLSSLQKHLRAVRLRRELRGCFPPGASKIRLTTTTHRTRWSLSSR